MSILKKWMRPFAMTALIVALIAPTLAGCMKSGDSGNKQEQVLKIGVMNYWGPESEGYLRQQYTELYEFTNKHVTVEFVPIVDYSSRRYGPMEGEEPVNELEEMKKVLNGDNPPDVVIVNYNQMKELINENLLSPLDDRMTKDKFNLDDFVPTVTEALSRAGNGAIYALTPGFSSSALFYNKQMFIDRGVDPPTDMMEWEEIFDLGRRVAVPDGENPIYGFSFSYYRHSDLFWDMRAFTEPLQLRMLDDSGEKLTVDSDAWEQVWKTLLDLHTQKVTPDPYNYDMPMPRDGEYNPWSYDNFISGNVAMVIAPFYYTNELSRAGREAPNYKNFTMVDWDVVTVPVHPEYPNIGGSVDMQMLMGMNTKAQNPEGAWDFIKFINGEDWARLKSKSFDSLMARKEFNKPREGMDFNIDAFTKLVPADAEDQSTLWNRYPYFGMVQGIGSQKFREVLMGEKGVREALQEWQNEGDQMIQQVKEDPQGGGGMMPF